MEIELSPDQRLFRATTRAFMDKEFPLARVRETAATGGRGFRGWWARAAELGWTALLAPEELGGGSVSGEGVRDLALLAETLGESVAPGALLATNIVLAGLVAAQADGGDHAAVIRELVGGASIATWAVYEPGRPWEPLEPGLAATPVADGHRLNGVKDRVELAGEADLFLVTADTGEGVAQFLVPADAGGITVRPQWSLDLARPFGEVRFDDVLVRPRALVGAVGSGAVVARQARIAGVLQCAEICGGLDRVFEMTTRWAADRHSFGRPLDSYQALKHRFADMRTWLEACHATTQAAAAAVQEHSPDADLAVSVAKSFVGDRSLRILQDCVQLHGGIGVTWEHDLHLYLRRATVDRALYGTPEDHRRRLADLTLS
ncbi:acyl-CoA dehydrogenase family protein [Actinocorallia libanotica]|uniref:Acyl-CoA dehydrogenase family protein n=2 Tax=Actinocorallia libanotica TaxID=46162 RepID=A0ABN1RMG4_9ACTN